MFKIVAFDMDGTIADTIPMCITAFRNSVSPYTDHELSSEEILHTFGLNEIGMVKAIVGQNWEAAIEDFYCQYESLHNQVKLINCYAKQHHLVSVKNIEKRSISWEISLLTPMPLLCCPHPA